MPFRSFVFSWRRVWAVVVLALLMIAAPQAAEVCDATCALARHAQPPLAATGATGAAGAADAAAAHDAAAHGTSAHAASHCGAHAVSSHAVHAAHACGMPAHALPVQVDAATAMAAPARASLAQLPQPLQTAALPAVASTSAAGPRHVPRHFEQTSAQSARSRRLTLALRL